MYRDFVFENNYSAYEEFIKNQNNILLTTAFNNILERLDQIIESIFIEFKLPKDLEYWQVISEKSKYFTVFTAACVISSVSLLAGYTKLEKSKMLNNIHVTNCKVEGMEHCYLCVDGYVLDFTYCQFATGLPNVLVVEEEKLFESSFMNDFEKYNVFNWMLLDSNAKLIDIFKLFNL